MKVGEVHSTNNSGRVMILKYNNAKSVIVEFESTGFRRISAKSDILKGKVSDPLCPSVYGVGFLGIGDHAAHIGKSPTTAYTAWKNMMKRCYSKACHSNQPTYIGCTVCADWHNFQGFANWFYDNFTEGLHLDKDIIKLGNKVYSKETCSFVPQAVNEFVVDSRASRGELPIGVARSCSKSNPFMAYCSNPFSGVREYLGLHSTPGLAHEAWRRRKHELACQLADGGLVTDDRVASALRKRYSECDVCHSNK